MVGRDEKTRMFAFVHVRSVRYFHGDTRSCSSVINILREMSVRVRSCSIFFKDRMFVFVRVREHACLTRTCSCSFSFLSAKK